MNTLQLLPDQTLSTKAILEDLCVLFPGVLFSVYRSDDVRNFITCFVAVFTTTSACNDLWDQVNSSVAAASQRILEGEIAPWNLYLLLSTPERLTKIVKYKIENDRFAARKITIASPELPGHVQDVYRTVLENTILGIDLELSDPVEKKYGGGVVSDLDDNAVRSFLMSRPGLVPQDRKPASSQLRKEYIRELINLAGKS